MSNLSSHLIKISKVLEHLLTAGEQYKNVSI